MRYAGRFNMAEINSSFHRPHRPSTCERWTAESPEGFRFAAKLPKTITHERRLVDTGSDLIPFLDAVGALGHKLGPLLIQLPPSLIFDREVAQAFLGLFRSRWDHALACEPRHPTWFGEAAETVLHDHEVARVAADPARVPQAAEPGGWPGLRYVRLHGSPRMYYSRYDETYLAELAARVATPSVETWCVFDNTASGAACANALELLALTTGR